MRAECRGTAPVTLWARFLVIGRWYLESPRGLGEMVYFLRCVISELASMQMGMANTQGKTLHL